MIEHRPGLRIFCHAMLALGVATVAFPLWITFVASTHTNPDIQQAPMPVLPGDQFVENYGRALAQGAQNLGASALTMMKNSLIMALGIAVGKIVVSLLAAFAMTLASRSR